MGLDMYALTLAKRPSAEVDFDAEGASEFHYWRKHPNLHGWMERLYRQKGGSAESFNCVNLLLNESDLEALETAIRQNALPHTRGLFFGESDGTELPDDLAFIAEARAALAAGRTVVYSSWW